MKLIDHFNNHQSEALEDCREAILGGILGDPEALAELVAWRRVYDGVSLLDVAVFLSEARQAMTGQKNRIFLRDAAHQLLGMRVEQAFLNSINDWITQQWLLRQPAEGADWFITDADYPEVARA